MVEALWMLFKSDVLSRFGNASLRRQMKIAVTRDPHGQPEDAIVAVVAAVNRACRYYPKSAACLQRSVALVSMLRKRGIGADLKIGVRQSPFTSHAWVEVAGRIINDAQSVGALYSTLHEFKAIPQPARGSAVGRR